MSKPTGMLDILSELPWASHVNVTETSFHVNRQTKRVDWRYFCTMSHGSRRPDDQLSPQEARPGDFINAGQQLFPLVEDNSLWVDANYKETDLQRISVGQPATIAVDMYPDAVFRGFVESISPASGAAFSMLPPENATGNWVKVTQRIPVRIRVINPDPATPLRIGVSTSVTIDTTSAAQENGSSAQEHSPLLRDDAGTS